MRRAFAGLATLQVLVLVTQFFLAASGAFDTAPKDESFRMHAALGFAIVLIAVVTTVVAAVARMPGRLVAMTGLVAGLAVLQPVLRAIAAVFDEAGGTTTAGELVFGLHAVNALAMLALSGTVARRSRQLAWPAASAQPAP